MSNEHVAEYFASVKSGLGRLMDKFLSEAACRLPRLSADYVAKMAPEYLGTWPRPNPARLYRQSFPPEEASKLVKQACDAAYDQHMENALATTPEAVFKRLGEAGAAFNTKEGALAELRESKKRIEEIYRLRPRLEVEPDYGGLMAQLPDDLRQLLTTQLQDLATWQWLVEWRTLAENNAVAILFDEAFPLEGHRALLCKAVLAERVVSVVYRGKPEGGNHIFGFLPAVLGDYGVAFGVSLVFAAAVANDLAEGCEDVSRELYRTMPDLVKRLARADDPEVDVALAPLRALREGVYTALVALGNFTVRRVPGIESPLELVRGIVNQGLVVEAARTFPAAVLGPLGLAGAYLPNLLVSSGGALALNPDLGSEMAVLQKATRALKQPAPVGYGCPMAFPGSAGEASGVEALAKVLLAVFEAIYPIVASVAAKG
jgi:hypothetical protein